VVIVSAEKPVPALTAPVPVELLAFGVEHTLALLAPARLRAVPASPDGGLIADYTGDVGDPAELAARLDATPGLVGHGLFAPELVSLVLVGEEGGVGRRAGAKA
jgi:ribose 5-phosphate isomerase A